MSSRFVLERDLPKLREQVAEREDVQNLRYQAKFAGRLQVGNLPDSSVLGLADVIRKDFKESAMKTGQLVTETRYNPVTRHEETVYYGDPRATWAPFKAGTGFEGKFTPLVHFEGHAYQEGRIPPEVATRMAIARAGGDPNLYGAKPAPPAAPEPKTGLLSKVVKIVKGE